MRTKLFQIIKENAESEGCTLENSLRDAFTDFIHIAADNGLDFEFAFEGAKEVFFDEIKLLGNVELSDGGALEPPDQTAEYAIRRLDVHGNCEEIRYPDEPNYMEWRNLFDDRKV